MRVDLFKQIGRNKQSTSRNKHNICMTRSPLIMDQHPKWQEKHLNKYISVLAGNVHILNIYDSKTFKANDISEHQNEGFEQNFIRSIVSSDSLSLLSSTVNSNYASLTQKQLHNVSRPGFEKLSDALQATLTSSFRDLNSTTTNFKRDDNHESFGSSPLMLVLIALYSFLVLGGVFGNASLIVTLFTNTSARLRNPLLVALCLADLMVTGVSATITIVELVIYAQNVKISSYICGLIYFTQSVPVAASTISLLMLSLDRYATVKHPRLAQLRQRRFLPTFFAFVSWISAICISIPILAPDTMFTNTNYSTGVNDSAQKSQNIVNKMLPNYTKSSMLYNISGIERTFEYNMTCQPLFTTMPMSTTFFSIYTLLVFILPGIGVVLNHLGVHQKLCALSLTARAAHGELPLPMPILRRPTHMIIVTGMANANAVREEDESTNDENDQQKDERRYMMDSTRLKATPRTPKSLRRSHIAKNRTSNTKMTAPSEFPLPQTSTLRSRRRLARLLVAGSFVFVICWSPYVIFLFCTKWSGRETHSEMLGNYSLFFGYAHSALNPILHWALNQNSLRQSALLSRLTSVQRFLQTRFHARTHQPPPSSTNEAALGPFNPRFIKVRPQQYNVPPASSHFMY